MSDTTDLFNCSDVYCVDTNRQNQQTDKYIYVVYKGSELTCVRVDFVFTDDKPGCCMSTKPCLLYSSGLFH